MTAANAVDARRLARQEKPDVAIVDVFLGETSGIELIRDLMRDVPSLRVVAYTAHLSAPIADEAASAGALRVEPKNRPLAEVVRLVAPTDNIDRRERIQKLERELLDLAARLTMEQWLGHALPFLVDATQADEAYLEIHDPPQTPAHWRSHNASDATVARVRSLIARQPVCTFADVGDAQHVFAELRSSGGDRAEGVLYVRAATGSDPAHVTHVAAAIAAGVRLVRERAPAATLHREVSALQERRIRDALLQYNGNVSEVARALGVGRAFVYRVMRRLR